MGLFNSLGIMVEQNTQTKATGKQRRTYLHEGHTRNPIWISYELSNRSIINHLWVKNQARCQLCHDGEPEMVYFLNLLI